MNESIDVLKHFSETLDGYIKKMNSKSKSGRNKRQRDIIWLAGELYEFFDGQEEKENGKFIPKVKLLLLDVQTAVEKEDIQVLKESLSDVNSILHQETEKQNWMQTAFEMFQKDMEKMKLESEILKSCQTLVDMDIKIYGEVSQKTKEILEVQHMELRDGYVREAVDKKEENVPGGNADRIKDLEDFVRQHKIKLERIEQESKKKTLVVNAYAGPGAGKTTACLETVAELKKMGYNAEYVPEYAKDLVYDNPEMLDGSRENQMLILLEQIRRLDRLMGKADIIVTDASILLNPVYLAEPDEAYENTIVQLYGQYENFNFYVHRGAKYVQEGRIENLEESMEKDQQIRDILDKNSLFYGNFSHKTVDKLAQKIEITYQRIKLEAREKEPSGRNEQQYEKSYQGAAHDGKDNKFSVIYGSNPEELISRLRTKFAEKFILSDLRIQNGQEIATPAAPDISDLPRRGDYAARGGQVTVRSKLEANKGKIEPLEHKQKTKELSR